MVFLDTGIGANSENGLPMFEGQALAHTSCGAAAYCHSERASGAARYGVPLGLDFDVEVVCRDVACYRIHDPSRGRVSRGVERVRADARDVFEAIERSTMPPGDVGRSLRETAPRFFRVNAADRADVEGGRASIAAVGRPLPGPSSVEGVEILRNWLACGAPIVERSEHDTLAAPGEACAVVAVGETGACIAQLDVPVIPPDPTWVSIYEQYMRGACSACHDPARSGLYRASSLDLSTSEIAYRELLENASAGDACGGHVDAWVIPGQAAASPLLEKLSSAAPCGESMPTSRGAPDVVLAALRTWIDGGAAR